MAVMHAATPRCRSAQLALSAQADGEIRTGESASARLHALTCPECEGFAAAIMEQRAGIAALVSPRDPGTAVLAGIRLIPPTRHRRRSEARPPEWPSAP